MKTFSLSGLVWLLFRANLLSAQNLPSACDLLPKFEVQELTGESVKSVTNQTKDTTGEVSACKYRLESFSCILTISQTAEEYEEALSLLENSMNVGTVRAERSDVTGLGDKAAWIEGPVMGILQVVKGKYIVTISSFSRKPAYQYLSVNKKLAERVLSHLSR